MQNRRTVFFFLFCSLFPAPLSTASDFSIEDYGQLEFMRSMAISPDGKHLAYIQRGENGDYFVIADVATNKIIGGADASKIKARSVYFATNRHVILRASNTERSLGIRGRWEHTGSIVYDLNTNKMRVLLNDLKNLYSAQSGLGSIVGLNTQDETVFMPAFIGNSNPSYDLIRANLTTGKHNTHAQGASYTTDWFVNSVGDVLAKEEFNDHEKRHSISAKLNSKWVRIYSLDTDIPRFSIEAVSADGKHLVFTKNSEGTDAIYKMALADGAMEGPLFDQHDLDIDKILTQGLNREFSGVLYSGMLPKYLYTNQKTQSHHNAMQDRFPDSTVHLLSASQDQSKILYLVSGNDAAGQYIIYDTLKRKLIGVGSQYPNIERDQIGEIKVMRYKARDNLPIQAVINWPVGIEERKNLPMLVFPHGGPESYDSIQFNWWAQYFARSGYVVFQPNFRGSTGAGISFRDAGRGEWGRKMQDDISDGVNAMIEAGHVDPARICIMGASYGGYAALAGGAFTPDLYKCVISVAGVSDIPKMLADTKYQVGYRHWVVNYWNEVVGSSTTEREKLKDISPVNFAENFKAPVLLLHGKDDIVVPLSQSEYMLKALKKAKQPVELVKLEGEDHWLSGSETRMQMLRRIAEFLEQHNPAIL